VHRKSIGLLGISNDSGSVSVYMIMLGYKYEFLTAKRVYQEFLARSLTEKYNNLNLQTDKIIHDANAEISSLRDRMDGLCPECYSTTIN
jgi:hypothetical protein